MTEAALTAARVEHDRQMREDAALTGELATDQSMRERLSRLEDMGFSTAAASVAAAPKGRQVQDPLSMFQNAQRLRPGQPTLDNPGVPTFNHRQVADALLVSQFPQVQQQVQRQMAETLTYGYMSADDPDRYMFDTVFGGTPAAYDIDANPEDIIAEHSRQVTGRAFNDITQRLNRANEANPYFVQGVARQLQTSVITRGEYMAARGAASALASDQRQGNMAQAQFYSADVARRELERGGYTSAYLNEEILAVGGQHEAAMAVMYAEPGSDEGAVESVRSVLQASGRVGMRVQESVAAQGGSTQEALEEGQRAFARTADILGGVGSGGGSGGGGGLIPTGGGSDGGEPPRLNVEPLQLSLDNLNTSVQALDISNLTHLTELDFSPLATISEIDMSPVLRGVGELATSLERVNLDGFAEAINRATAATQSGGGIGSAEGRGETPAPAGFGIGPAEEEGETPEILNQFSEAIGAQMQAAMQATFFDAQGNPLFGGGGELIPSPLGTPQLLNPYEAERRRRRAERGEPQVPDGVDPDVNRSTGGDLIRAFFGGMLGRQATSADTAGMRKAGAIGALTRQAGGGLLKTLFNKTVGVATGILEAGDIPSAVAAYPVGGVVAAPLNFLRGLGQQGAGFEMPALQATFATTGAFNQGFATEGAAYKDIKAISSNLGIDPTAAAGMLRDATLAAGVTTAGGKTMGNISPQEIMGLFVRGYDVQGIASMVGRAKAEDLGGMSFVKEMMGIGQVRGLSQNQQTQLAGQALEFAVGRQNMGLNVAGGNANTLARRAIGMSAGRGISAGFASLGRFQGVGLGASKGITSFATGMLDQALQAYAFNKAGGDFMKAQQIIEELSANPAAMRAALREMGISDEQIDTMMLGTGQLTTEDVRMSKRGPAATASLSTTPYSDKGNALFTSRAIATKTQEDLKMLFGTGEGSERVAERFATLLKETTKFQKALLTRVPTSRQIELINAQLLMLVDKVDIAVEIGKFIAGDRGTRKIPTDPAVTKYKGFNIQKQGRGSVLSGGANYNTGR